MKDESLSVFRVTPVLGRRMLTTGKVKFIGWTGLFILYPSAFILAFRAASQEISQR